MEPDEKDDFILLIEEEIAELREELGDGDFTIGQLGAFLRVLREARGELELESCRL